MKLTLDRMCIQSGRLCASCDKLYQNDVISDIDIEIGKILMNTAKSQKFLSNITILKIVETQRTVFVISKVGDVEKLLRAASAINSVFSQKDKRALIFLEKTKNPKKFIQGLIGIELLVSTSTVFLPPFSEKELKVQVKESNKSKLRILSEDLSKITNALLGMDAHYSFI
ncbi:MAG: hypothetical protein GPJ54_09520 [Candidatus Heimdallarchaeota archaeon]|nr:hypothetical protein [Candidatus Heimdallarchaeota archaeon]